MLEVLVQISKLEIGRMPLTVSAISLHDALEEAYILTYLAVANRNVKLQIDFAPDADITVAADPIVLRQALVTLVTLILPDLSAGQLTIGVQTSADPETVQVLLKGEHPFRQIQAILTQVNPMFLQADQLLRLQLSVLNLNPTEGITQQFTPETQLVILQTFLRHIQGKLILDQLESIGAIGISLKCA